MAKVNFTVIGKEVGVKPQGKTEADVNFAERILTKIDHMTDPKWDRLSISTQEWYLNFCEKP